MKILHTIAGFSAKSGGTSTCTYDLLNALNKQECHSNLLTLDDVNKDKLMGDGETWIHTLPFDCVSPYGFSYNLRSNLKEEARSYDILHTNGLWMYCNHITCEVARKQNKPYVITPHGMLYPEALKRSYWKKWPLIQLFFKKDILEATCLHATCKEEMNNIRLFGYKGPIAIIPNPCVIPIYANSLFEKKKQLFLERNNKIKFGFLGRLHPRKKVENLIYGMSSLANQQNCELIIMGKGDDSYEQFLHNEVKRLHLKNVTFRGFVTGKEKYEELSRLSCLFVPSDFENFGMIITEALSMGTPVMASLGTPWKELNTYGCGWWTERTPENIIEIMKQVISMDTNKLLAMGEKARQLVEEKYTDTQAALKMKQLYEWILNGGDKPAFVYL